MWPCSIQLIEQGFFHALTEAALIHINSKVLALVAVALLAFSPDTRFATVPPSENNL